MSDLIDAFADNKHILLAAGAVFVYFKWQEQRKKISDALERERDSHRTLTEEIIRSSLANGIGERMRQIIQDHEKVEAANLDRVIEEIRAEKHMAHKDMESRIEQLEDHVGRPRARRGS